MPELRKTTVRISETIRTLIEEEAAHDGISVAQFIREAALARALYQRGRRGDDALADKALELAEGIYAEVRERLGNGDEAWEGPERRSARGRRRSD